MRKSVGTAASYGCIRMYNEDVVDLYHRVAVGTPSRRNSMIRLYFRTWIGLTPFSGLDILCRAGLRPDAGATRLAWRDC